MTTKTTPTAALTTLASRLRERPILALVGVIALILALGLGTTALFSDSPEGPARSGAVTAAGGEEVTNESGGYRMVVPEGWRSTQEGRTTTVTNPARDASLTAGVGTPGPLEEAAALFFQQVGRNYADVEIGGVESQRVGERDALVWAGSGTNNKNVRIRFLAITVQNAPANYAISVFTAADSDAEQILPRVNQVVDSFRPLG